MNQSTIFNAMIILFSSFILSTACSTTNDGISTQHDTCPYKSDNTSQKHNSCQKCKHNSTLESKKELNSTILKFIGDVSFPTTTVFQGTPLGGISGIYFDSNNLKLWGISDDRSKFAPARAYSFKIDFSNNSFFIQPDSVVSFKNNNQETLPINVPDFEGIVLDNNKIIITSEGGVSANPLIPPSITIFNLDGSLNSSIPLPEQFIPNNSLSKGIRDNLGPENLTITPDHQYLFTANEQALAQDGDITTVNNGSIVRLVRYLRINNKFIADKAYPYFISPIPNPTQLSSVDGDNGLVDLAAIDKNNLYTLERSWNGNILKNTIRIFKISINEDGKNADLNVINEEQLPDNIKPIKKELVLDLDEVIPLMSDSEKRLDNIEGICFGPKLSNGNQTLIVVSDNNFSSKQRTLFMAFEIVSP